MRLSLETKRWDLKLVECKSLWSLLRRWAAKLWRLLEQGGDK
jgi:hypothetical protein